jgi:hypothetical protein
MREEAHRRRPLLLLPHHLHLKGEVEVEVEVEETQAAPVQVVLTL